MSEDIYSDIWGEVLYKKGIGSRIYLYDGTGYKEPALILSNKLAVEKLIDYLTKSLKEMRVK